MTEIKLNQCNNSQQQPEPECGTSSKTSNGLNKKPEYKKTQSFMYPVYKFVGKNKKPKPKERATLILLGIMLILFIISVTGFFIMWLTEIYNNSYISQLVLSNNSEAADLWLNSPIHPHLKVHIFNYTNMDRYLENLDDKIKVDDLGPYTYEEHSKKVNVSFNTNYTVTYKDYRWYKFLPELSSGLENDSFIIPNVPLLSAAFKLEDLNYFARTTARVALNAMSLKPFKKLQADEIIWGYNDEVMVLQQFASSDSDPYNGKFGMLMKRNGTSPDSFQIHTGEDDLEKVGIISLFNGMKNLNFWSTDECNRIDGTDGSQFPPHLMNKDTKLYVFLSTMCRKLPLEFEREVELFDDVTAWRYRTPLNVFQSPDIYPENECYCNQKTGKCPPSGVMDGTKCYDGAPIFPSFPHFFSGNPEIYSKFDGIRPIKELHQTYADIHPRLAFPINGASRIQINIQLNKKKLLKNKLNGLDDGIILPVLWIEVTNGELTDGVRKFIYYTTVIANLMQFALKYGTLLTCVTSFALLVAAVYYLSKSADDDNDDDDDDSDNISEKEPELESLHKVKV